VIIFQLSTAVPENMTHESHFREVLQALHHSLVLDVIVCVLQQKQLGQAKPKAQDIVC